MSNEPCIIWDGALTPDGYPRKLYNGNENTRYHRVIFADFNGLTLADLKGVIIRHSCDNTLCINPKHLLKGTHADNMLDRSLKDRHPATRVSLKDAVEIAKRLDAGENGIALAEELGLPHSTVLYQRQRVRRLGLFAV